MSIQLPPNYYDDDTDPREFHLSMKAHEYAREKHPNEYENRESGGDRCLNSILISAVIDAYKKGFNDRKA